MANKEPITKDSLADSIQRMMIELRKMGEMSDIEEVLYEYKQEITANGYTEDEVYHTWFQKYQVKSLQF